MNGNININNASFKIEIDNGTTAELPNPAACSDAYGYEKIKVEDAETGSSNCDSYAAVPEIGSKNSAFLPYKQQSSLTVLTNLQRGNVQTQTKDIIPEPLSFHERAAKGEVDYSEIHDDNVNSLDEHGINPLMWACFHGRLSTSQMLVEKGALVNYKSIGGETALMFAATNGHLEIITLLLSKGALVDLADEHGNTALMYATVSNHPRCITELLNHGASLTKTNEMNDSPFHIATSKNLHAAQHAMENFLKEYIELNLLIKQEQL